MSLNYNGDSGSPDNENSEAKPIEKQNNKSNFYEQCLVDERLKIAVTSTRSFTKVRASKVRDKGLHISRKSLVKKV